MTAQLVRPASAGHETLYVLLLCLLILLLAGTVVGWRAETQQEHRIDSHQLDARRDLTAAEQGIYADLRVAFEEIQLRQQEEQALPDPHTLALEGFPPFAADVSRATRGDHHWQLVASGDDAAAYLGLSTQAAVAGSFLLRAPHGQDSADIWLNRAADAAVPAELGAGFLIAAGWQQVAARFDAGVTRHAH